MSGPLIMLLIYGLGFIGIVWALSAQDERPAPRKSVDEWHREQIQKSIEGLTEAFLLKMRHPERVDEIAALEAEARSHREAARRVENGGFR